MDTSLFDFELPADRIAQRPLPDRDASRLMVLPRREGPPAHRMFRDLPALLDPGDLLVVNDARVLPARLYGKKAGTGGRVELLLCDPLAPGPDGTPRWRAMGQASKTLRPGARVEIGQGFAARVEETLGEGWFAVTFEVAGGDLEAALQRHGHLPLPHYIERPDDAADRERYQTIFARVPGAVAAPTAGLHFSPAVLDALAARGIHVAAVTLHVGPGTFLPVRAARVEDHVMHAERYVVPEETARAYAEARARRARVIAVGTTALRTLESALHQGALRPGPGETRLFLKPGDEVRSVDGLVTNFHLPRSTLVMLVSALAGRERLLAAYAEAMREGYRFFSYGDAMLLL